MQNDGLQQYNHQNSNDINLSELTQIASCTTGATKSVIKTIVQLFEEQVSKVPDNIALVYENIQMSYQELNEKSNQLARYMLDKYALQNENLVALCLDRSCDMLIAILAVLKAGCAYVPIEPSYPEERIKYILEDAKPTVIVTSQKYRGNYQTDELRELIIDDEPLNNKLSGYTSVNLNIDIINTNLAYVIYTSGTTGKPKGVLQQHNNVSRLFSATEEWYQFNCNDVWTLFHSYVFDFSVWEMWGALCYGGKLVIPSYLQTRDFELFYNLCANERVTVLNQTPIAFYQFMQTVLSKGNFNSLPDLRYAFFGGEKINLNQLKPWFNIYGYTRPQLINVYGITETTVLSTFKAISAEDMDKILSIGTIIPDQFAYVLDDNLQQLPIGDIGELHIGGMGLARGYLNLPQLTKERFIHNPFQTDEEKLNKVNDKLYKTGDLVRYLSDGTLEYIGRNDFQVKIRGFRIELSEIESKLTEYPKIKQAVVLAKELSSPNNTGTNKYLIGYYVSETKLDEAEIFEYLLSRLPDYMLPNALLHLQQLPITVNGKLDRGALPDVSVIRSNIYVAPANQREIQVCQIFAEVLNLSVDMVGTTDDFFRLGGNSILAIKLIGLLKQRLNLNITVSQLLVARTIRKMLSEAHNADISMIKPELTDKNHIMSTTESGILNHLLLIGLNDITYNESFIIDIKNDNMDYKDCKYLQSRLDKMSDALCMLHANYIYDGEGFKRVINKSRIYVEEIYIKNDWSLKVAELARIPFDIAKDKLIRIYLLKKDNLAKICIVVHHLIIDSTSASNIFCPGLLNKNFNLPQNRYDSYAKAITEINLQYQNNRLNKMNYWQLQLEMAEIIPLPAYNALQPIVGKQISFSIDTHTIQQIKQIIQAQGISLFSVLFANFCVCINKFYNLSNTLIRTNIDERIYYPQAGDLFGCLVNHVFLSTASEPSKTLLEFTHQVQQNTYAAMANAVGFQDIIKINREKVTQLAKVQFNLDVEELTVTKDYIQSQLCTHSGHIKNDLFFELDSKSNQMLGRVEFNTQSFSPQQIESIIDCYKFLLTSYADNLNKTVTNIQLIDSKNYINLMLPKNKTTYPQHKTIVQLFEEQVSKVPDNIALVYENIQISYLELNEKSNRLARYMLDKYALQNENLVALCLDRSCDMLIAILAVLKAGCAYVPIEPSYPEERIKYILEDAKPKVIVTSQKYCGNYQTDELRELIIDDEVFHNQLSGYTSTNLNIDIINTNLAYVIYTSGTTGKPKGVLQQHNNVSRLFSATEEWYQFNCNDVWTLFHSYVFDFSVWEMWGALCYGGKLIIPSYLQTRDFELFYNLCANERVTVLNQTPTAFYQFMQTVLSKGNFNSLPDLRYVIFGGEAINLTQLKPWFKTYGYNKPQLINMYGITETTVHTTYKPITAEDINNNSLIGVTIPDQFAYVLDNNLQPLPIGAIGELYIGGMGLARGYLNLPQLTQEKFIPNTFQTDEEKLNKINERLYKTGDLVRYLSDRSLEYIGRNDFQVKIRGFRIELSEIEVAINNSHPDIQQAIVLVYEKSTQDKSKYLVAYYVSKHKLDEITIHQKLSDMLPDYMLPNVLLWLERLPLTINGKLDRAALPKPQFKTDNCYVIPVNEIERTMCQIWQNVLEIEQVGTQYDFFKLGGDSILSIRLVAKMKAIGINVSTRDIFIHRTIKNILDCCDVAEIISNVEYIRFSLVGDAEKIIAVNRFNPNQIEDIYPASYLQMGMVLEYEKNNSNYHIVTTHTINQIFNVELFTQIFNGLIDKHALLRTAIIHDKTYGFINVQYKSINVTDKLHVVDNTIIDKLITDELNHKINPENPGMFRIVIKPQENWFTLILTTHHAIEDGWSVASLIAEFITAYCNKSSTQKCIIPSYAKFISSEQQVLNNIKFKEFWLNYLNNYEPDNRQKLIFDYTLPKPIEQFEVTQNLDNTVSLQTLALANKLNISPDLIFLSVYTLVLSRFLNRNDLVVGVVVNNRLEEPGGDKLFGLHLNTIPVRFNIDNDSFNNVDNYISRVGANKLAVDEYKLYPYGKIKSDMGMHEDIYQCAFNYTNFHIVGDIYDTGLIKSSDSNANVNIPLVLNISRTYDKFAIHINANSEFIDKNTAHQLLDYFRTYLCDTLENNSVNLLPKKDYNKIIHVWNNTDKAYLNNKTIHQLFEEQVQKTPNDIAVVYENQNISYAELNIKANQLAHYLSSTYKIAKDDLIALYTNRSLYMIIAMLGALKAGAAYVPIDPDYPHERFLHILKDSLPKAILTQNEYQSKLIKSTSEINSRYPLDILALDNEEFCAACLSSQPVYNPQIYTASNSLAYVIYTSGTTGVPKGVMIEHKSVVNLVQYIIPRHQLNLYNNVLFYSNYVFDASVYEIFPALLNGNQLFIANEVIRHDLGQLIEYINLNQISVLFLPSVLVPEFVNQYNGTSVKVLFTGGDSLQNLPKYNLNYSIINEYGPTENTVCTTTYDVKNNVLIGKVIDNGKCYILDNNQQPLPVGAIGELYVGGAGLARGYLNLPDLTEEKFIPNPFQTELEKLHKINERLYCTGDLVRYRFDGNIEYIRRNDFQVKINGLRIELGEIENTLLSYRSIRQAVVVVHEYNSGDSADSVKSLIAYYVADSRQDEDGIVNYLADKLPEYMLPRHLIYLSSLPVTNNGKLDRGALPKPTSDQSTEYVEPKNDLEIMLCNAYTQVLRLKTGKVGVTNDFFKLGGNSILAIKLISQLNLQLQLKLKVVDLFVSKTVAKLAEIIGQQQQLATQICVKLNDAKNCPNMFMIHPGTGGCEVYTALAKDLEHKFICYGIDSYNIYSVNKIDNLSQLAAYYLAQIDKVMHQTNQQEYILLGWSLGGQIGAEIAAILEARGETKIKLILLDTYFTSPNEDSDMHTKTSVNNDIQWLQSYLLNTYDLQYAQSVIANMPIQDKLANTQISRKLKHTEIYLFKAMMPYRSESGNLIQISNNNHVDLICLKHNLISTVMLEYAHHFNILADKQILNYICNIPCVY